MPKIDLMQTGLLYQFFFNVPEKLKMTKGRIVKFHETRNPILEKSQLFSSNLYIQSNINENPMETDKWT